MRLDRPEPRIALGVALRHLARSAIDLSDGLIGDLGHICERSRVGAEVALAELPLAAAFGAPPHARETYRDVLSGGDDYELLFSAAPENRAAIAALGGSLRLALTRIGAIVAGEGIRLLDARGAQVRIDARGFDHFA